MNAVLRILDRVDLAGEPGRNARVTALIVFTALYLAVGMGLAEIYGLWGALIWPYYIRFVLRTVLFALAAFMVAALYVYWLKLRFAMSAKQVTEDSLRVRASNSELTRCQDMLQRAMAEHSQAEIRAQAAEANARTANERAAAAEEKARAAQKGPAGQQSGSPGKDDRFQAAKRAFARLYHPDNIKAEGFDKIIRAEIFKEYWRELETIEKSAKR